MSERKGIDCDKCGRNFRDTYKLKRHRERKTPCVPIVNPEDIPEEKKGNPKCKFCGRAFSTRHTLTQHMRKTCKIVPRDGDTSGMDKLYEHVLKRQEEMAKQIEELKAANKQLTTQAVPAPAAVAPATVEHKNALATAGRDAIIDQSTKNVTINIFGAENTSHITQKDVLGLFRGLGPLAQAQDLRKASDRIILSMAAQALIYSDEKHPAQAHITCYLPSKKGKEALVHAEGGWEVMPVSLTLSPMAAKSVDELCACR